MSTIYKYPIEVSDQWFVELPRASRILCVQMQNGSPWIWALVDTTAPKAVHRFDWHPTGRECNAPGVYVGTVQDNGMVFHLFYQGPVD